ncbi:phosphoribosylglycinamide formyltransferase [Photobacterium angustum]|uniref:Phosphoribosylglycinamide formyltransferase n=1 Tax=Photobacterium angustum TaxID=661 RepID=A0A855S642_PHOAN|nr:phosphoribosylglycinamide formyltransferase [Photobacterium angustum]KJF79957.1 phosphoribosylglycinamide formyltransferase [Photobacterium damselae subsp. damselae]KJG36122.1 phosphoribosylglycinamide formyltransferase [Photobacterium angustum]KJG43436.1 phosphoribosylglycinamide formyltransferase [Photobacterium angustum]KJG51356.1 phosphoribosylglycinamide formyltransferase [Photobacterium angustum]PSW87582.1 phosphoribosylglycinamide formyltransferase [Photobacterium angustum]
MKNIVVLISGSGSNLQAIIDACSAGLIKNSQITAVISNKESAYGLERARNANIEAIHIAPNQYADREQYDEALADCIEQFKPDVVILAGFMRILSADFVRRFKGKMLNVHPSLLPKYPGLNTHQRAMDAGDNVHGTSVHFVTEELDGGPVILQARVPIFDNDTVEEVTARVQKQEHAIYPLVTQWLAENRLTMSSDGKAILDGIELPAQGYAAQ